MVDLPFRFHHADLVATPEGALWWPQQRVLAVADLHFEKGSAFAARGVPLPPYDTLATVLQLEGVVSRLQPQRVLALGDSFHDRNAHHRIDPSVAERLAALVRRLDWLWLVGNHDPEPKGPWGGQIASSAEIGPLSFRHDASGAMGEVSGHWHPKARVWVRGGSVARRCFVLTPRHLILPAFGSFTGGLDVRDPALARVIGPAFEVLMCGRDRVSRLAAERLERPVNTRSAPYWWSATRAGPSQRVVTSEGDR